ncbi:MAG: FAD-dependent thymidylate synthase [Candidatus Dojkabacteria bacterium]|nr:FAD-dependent thymidylate synthase [Candidatus Dojkabacteria bacterium]
MDNQNSSFSDSSKSNYSIKRYTNPELEKILGIPVPVLDHGFIRVIDYMGGDDSIVQAARVSYGKGTKTISTDRNLIRYLMRHRHTTPFEMCEIKFHIKLPIFVARQWIRHRTANVNEYSARYSILDSDFYLPETLETQSKNNKQGRGDRLEFHVEQKLKSLIREHSENSYRNYLSLLGHSTEYVSEENTSDTAKTSSNCVAREIARIVVPLNFYTQWYWKIDLHNLFHFLSLRTDSHAQFEIREYANKILDIVKIWVPLAYEAFEDYVLKGIRLSKYEQKIVQRLLNGEKFDDVIGEYNLSVREIEELRKKFSF